MLETANIDYQQFETLSADWIDEWVEDLRPNDFTEFVVIGGDGMFVNFINALNNTPVG